ncbi:Tpr And Ankyrin Repeat-Containing Protein 1 [Manis pentadactyla]|nr:Tpr And Ankyrin Repeat-Containing Protein 1 [Manis pentadactyla]
MWVEWLTPCLDSAESRLVGSPILSVLRPSRHFHSSFHQWSQNIDRSLETSRSWNICHYDVRAEDWGVRKDSVPHRELAVLQCHKSDAFCSLRKWDEAFVAAKECLRWDPTCGKP